VRVSNNDILQGFGTVEWAGRYEILSHNPLIIADGAHNVDSIKRVIEATHFVFPGKKIHLLFGTSIGKDVEGMLRVLIPECDTCVFTQSVHPKSMPLDMLVQLAQQMGYPAHAKMPVEQALRKALQDISEDDLLLCTGSLFIAAAVRDIWYQVMKEMQDE
jgi:dihydrofolate synthase/folylpolyglutamate synthase